MIHHEENDIVWSDSIEDFKPDYTPVKVWSVLQLYILNGKTTNFIEENLAPIKYLYYCVYDPTIKRYYKRLARPYLINEVLHPERPTLIFGGDDHAIGNLLRYIGDGNLWALYTTQQINDVRGTLDRVYRANLNYQGKLDYRLYIQILTISLKLEDFRANQKNITGYRTVINQMEGQVRDLWAKASIPKI
jgi:hypothetical protein